MVDFTTDTKVYKQLWTIRKGTFPAVGAVRETGTTVIIEVCRFFWFSVMLKPGAVAPDVVGQANQWQRERLTELRFV